MDFIRDIVLILAGGGTVGAIISTLFARMNHKDSIEVDLLDRAYTEINRLDKRVQELRRLEGLVNSLEFQLQVSENKNKELQKLVDELKEVISELKLELKATIEQFEDLEGR